jgi:hypothetical protein
MEDEKMKIGVDDILENETTIKDIILNLTQNTISISIVLCMLYMTLKNNQPDFIKTAFDMVLGFWIGTRQIGK